MSRIGRMPVVVPAGVSVDITDANHVTVKGPKGHLTQGFHSGIGFEKKDDGHIVVTRSNDEKESRALHGLSRALLKNMVVGVSQGFTKELEINGVGYRATKQGRSLVMNLGFSHQVIVEEVEGISIEVVGTNRIIISGPDKQQVGQFAADIREKRPPEPYKGKGIKYANETIRRKAGKTGGKK